MSGMLVLGLKGTAAAPARYLQLAAVINCVYQSFVWRLKFLKDILSRRAYWRVALRASASLGQTSVRPLSAITPFRSFVHQKAGSMQNVPASKVAM